jgi:hypothetical protein
LSGLALAWPRLPAALVRRRGGGDNLHATAGRRYGLIEPSRWLPLSLPSGGDVLRGASLLAAAEQAWLLLAAQQCCGNATVATASAITLLKCTDSRSRHASVRAAAIPADGATNGAP